MRKKHPEHVNLERWLVSYADFITLLFAFFVIMYAISQADLSKFQKLSAGIRQAFSSGPVGMVDLGGASGGNTANPFDMNERQMGKLMDMPAGKTNTATEEDPQIREIQALMEESMTLEVGTSDLSDKLQMQYDSRGLVVRVATRDFFGDKAVEPRQDLWPVFDRIGRILSKSQRLIRVEGHTDPGEANVGSFASDWELSSARAAWVAKYWIKRFGLDPSKIGIAGYSHYRPVSKGTDSWDRAKNRRVEIIILNNRYTQ